MKALNFLIIIFVFYSCKENSNKEECQKYISELNFLKEYSNNKKDTTYLIQDITNKIEAIEDFTSIKSLKQGDWIGKHEVSSKDIKAWEDWFKKNCN